MKPERKVYKSMRWKVVDFVIGVILVIVLSFLGVAYAYYIVIFGWLNYDDQYALSICLAMLPWAIDIGLMIYFWLTRHWITLGMLSAYVAGFMIYLWIFSTLIAKVS